MSQRLEYLNQWVKENFIPNCDKDGPILNGTAIREAGLDCNITEYLIIIITATIAHRELIIKSGQLSYDELKLYHDANRNYQQELRELSLSLV